MELIISSISKFYKTFFNIQYSTNDICHNLRKTNKPRMFINISQNIFKLEGSYIVASVMSKAKQSKKP